MGRKKKENSETAESPIIEKIKSDTLNAVDENKLNEIKAEYEENKTETRGRRKKKDLEAETKAQDFAGVLTFSASIGLDILVKRLPKPTPLTPEEKENFDKAFTQLALKYYSSVQRFGEEVNFSLILLFILLPRFEFKKKETPETKETSSGQK